MTQQARRTENEETGAVRALDEQPKKEQETLRTKVRAS